MTRVSILLSMFDKSEWIGSSEQLVKKCKKQIKHIWNNSLNDFIKKLSKMCTKKENFSEIKRISSILYEQSKILDGEKPTDPALFSKNLIDTIYLSLK